MKTFETALEGSRLTIPLPVEEREILRKMAAQNKRSISREAHLILEKAIKKWEAVNEKRKD